MHSALNDIIKPTFDEFVGQIRMKKALNDYRRKIVLIQRTIKKILEQMTARKKVMLNEFIK